MPIHGTIEEAGLPDVLQLLALGRKTGCLSVSDGSLHGEIYLEVGRVSYATLAHRDRLGEILLRHGRINREQLTEATAEQARGSDRALGRILLQSGAIERADIERYVRLQVEEAVYTLFTWKKGAFTFTSDEKPTRGSLPVSLDPESLLLEGARRVDEWSLIEKKIPSFDLVYQRTRTRRNSGGGGGGGSSDDFTEDQRRILPLLDGTRDVAGIAEITGMGDFEVGKALYGLIIAGIVRLVERRAQIRHLEYRELLAYVVREAELADPQRRKAVARHIVDCPTCSERLRTIHVRRTEGKGIPMPTEAEVMQGLASDSTSEPVPREEDVPLAHAPEMIAAPAPVVERRGAPRLPAAASSASSAPTLPATPVAKTKRVVPPAPAASSAPTIKTPVYIPAAPPAPAASDLDIELDLVEEVPAAAAPPTPPAPVAPPAPPVQPQARERETRDARQLRQPDRRGGDRRAGMDRRQQDRRAGYDRRQQVNAAWAQTYQERRNALRRTSDVPGSPGQDRRGTGRRGAGEPRRIDQVQPAPAQMPAPIVMPAAPVAIRRQVSPPPTPIPGSDRPSSDLVWLMSPDESMQLIRASRSQMRPPPEAAAATPPPPPATRQTPRTTTAASAARRSPPPARAKAATPAGRQEFADENDLEPAEVVRRSGKRSRQVPLPQPMPKRNFGIAAMFVLVGLGAYAAGHMGARAGSTATPLEEASAATPAESAPPPATHPGRVAGRQAAPPETQRVPDARTPAPAISTPRVPSQAPASQPNARVQAPAQQTPVVSAPVNVPAQQAAAPAPPQQAAPQVQLAASTPPAPAATPPAASAAAPVPSGPAPTAAEPDRELATGGWSSIDRAEAITLMAGGIAAIPGLPIESISRSVTGTRARVRITQLTPDGQRIVLTETRSGATRVGPSVVTAVRVMPPSEAYPFSTGTVSLGNLLITAKSSITADALQPLLQRLSEIQ